MKNYTTIKQVCVIIMGVSAGILIGVSLDCEHENTKHYPIEVLTHWETGQNGGYPTMEVDSIKGDSIWRDGLMIRNKNIVNIKFK